MHPILKTLLIYCLALTGLISAPIVSAQDTPLVLVSIKPLHSLVAGVMQGVATPLLLMKSNQSLHHYSLRPSERRAITRADLIFWIGPELETSLSRLLTGRSFEKKSVALINSDKISRLKNLAQHQHVDDHHPHGTDPHIWLSSRNASAIIDVVADNLIDIDPENSLHYEVNRIRLKQKVSRLAKRLKSLLNDHKQPYITFHNSIRYFEDEFQLNDIAAVQNNPESQPSAQHISHIVKIISEDHITCLFHNQGEKPRLITSLQKQTSVTAHALNPVGLGLPENEDTWFDIMDDIALKINGCLNNDP